MSRFFLDTEFIEAGPKHPLYLISIGIVAENGAEYYAESSEFPSNLASPWVREHVFPLLTWKTAKPLSKICQEICQFVKSQSPVVLIQSAPGVEKYTKPKFWGWFSSYDWVLFCQIFGTMMDLPIHWPQYCNDLKQLCVSKGDPKLIKPENEHHALVDARWNRDMYNFLMKDNS